LTNGVQHGQPAKRPVMIVLSAGQAYVLPDMVAQTIPDGTTLVEFFERGMR
jgi:hypothetical protein